MATDKPRSAASQAFNLLVRPQIVPDYAVGVRSQRNPKNGAALGNGGGGASGFLSHPGAVDP